MVADRHVEQRCVQRGDGTEEVDAMVRDDLPESPDDAFPAIALRRPEHDVRAARERQQPRYHRRVHMKEGQPAEYGLAGADAVAEKSRGAPRIRHFVAVTAHRDLRQTGRAAGTEERRHVAGCERTGLRERRARLARDRRVEVVKRDA
ncbi:hypothetical protein KTD19_30445 [Burkholderia multivorans]|nr:hypothetical protein [Burkholderia multivorans]MBU9236692.1 hypothetical protein [Burkholderia multivorans]MBU9354676.1 hypothetical protein [Burkholderia multivorans]MBU9462781.1 hypothetical protein [Burkholderia multivorans]MBU9527281.1 hypothetical protein [Burkholderia multivorans]